ncbi:DUF6249 domain-containing protein [Bacteroides sp. GD17]|jgi:hypothetical protein|uniref:DUF6249 domain-containing protein n=1 Tax=Bacteroides sp. GD17 TaxID=3139826 RepID=UPI0025E64D81|nr:DUF6249 domain-containing protein [uncultured Bacteroides sp.]
MMDFIMVPAVMTIITLGVYKLFELFVCKRERIMLIEKMGDQPEMPKMPVAKLYGNFSNFSFSALKIGCLLAGMGLGLLIGYFICYATIPEFFTTDRWAYRETASLIYGACVLGFGGIGLITSFVIELKLNKK